MSGTGGWLIRVTPDFTSPTPPSRNHNHRDGLGSHPCLLRLSLASIVYLLIYLF